MLNLPYASCKLSLSLATDVNGMYLTKSQGNFALKNKQVNVFKYLLIALRELGIF